MPLRLIADIKTYVKNIDENNIGCWEDLLYRFKKDFKNDGYVVAYLHYTVLIGKFTEGKLQFYKEEKFEPKYLIRIRIFNETRELLLWNTGENLFKGRLRIDGGEQGENEDIVEAKQVLWGTKSKELDDGWTRISEDRGVELIIPPIDGVNIELKPKKPEKRMKLITRNYIGNNRICKEKEDDGIYPAGYIDSRFVKFVMEEA